MAFLALVMIAAGTLLAYSGRKGYTPTDTFHWVLNSGSDHNAQAPVVKLPLPTASSSGGSRPMAPGPLPGQPGYQDPTKPGGTGGVSYNLTAYTGRGPAMAADAARYLGIAYRFGGASPQAGFDCSGLVTWVLHHDLGVNLPNNSHTVVSQFRSWNGAQTVNGPAMPGDLVIYGVDHMGIAVSASQMIAAPHTGTVVQRQNIYGSPMFRRVVV